MKEGDVISVRQMGSSDTLFRKANDYIYQQGQLQVVEGTGNRYFHLMDGADGGRERIMPEYIPADYREAAAYIEELPKFTKKHPLNHTREFMNRLGNPAEKCKVIHVAGTNGKGSVCAYIQAILAAEGKKNGFFTSPHLVSVNERIQIDRIPVSDDIFYEVFCKAYRTAKEMEQEGLTHPSYFEFLFGMGMLAFEKSQVEYVILETGLGGRLDATNSVEHPLLTVITSVSLDHTDILGDTIQKIAYEKAGIIKKEVPVFFDGNDTEASKVIKKCAKEQQAPCREISKNAFEIQEVETNRIAFSRKSAYDKDVIWHVPIRGVYQVMRCGACAGSDGICMAEGREPPIEEKEMGGSNCICSVGRTDGRDPGTFSS